jgi:glycine cleavage system pyridoxal-binding protein P
VHALTRTFAAGCASSGFTVGAESFFDTVRVQDRAKRAARSVAAPLKRAEGQPALARRPAAVGVALDETTTAADVTRCSTSVFALAGARSRPRRARAAGGEPHARRSRRKLEPS